MRIQRLSAHLTTLFGGSGAVDLDHALFRAVTHLDLFDVDTRALLPNVGTLPALTHLCVGSHVPRVTALQVLVDCPRLALLLMQWHVSDAEEDSADYESAVAAYTVARVPCVYDVRFVIGRFAAFWDDWATGARGGYDAWASTDRFVARKRKGEVKATRYWLH
ncbi:hypothetical protein DFH06DRAFT_324443 [Mycena polygramma]|nr:hypothetical protein DFH06DRAFT_324443 [Mycena polygramma]